MSIFSSFGQWGGSDQYSAKNTAIKKILFGGALGIPNNGLYPAYLQQKAWMQSQNMPIVMQRQQLINSVLGRLDGGMLSYSWGNSLSKNKGTGYLTKEEILSAMESEFQRTGGGQLQALLTQLQMSLIRFHQIQEAYFPNLRIGERGAGPGGTYILGQNGQPHSISIFTKMYPQKGAAILAAAEVLNMAQNETSPLYSGCTYSAGRILPNSCIYKTTPIESISKLPYQTAIQWKAKVDAGIQALQSISTDAEAAAKAKADADAKAKADADATAKAKADADARARADADARAKADADARSRADADARARADADARTRAEADAAARARAEADRARIAECTAKPNCKWINNNCSCEQAQAAQAAAAEIPQEQKQIVKYLKGCRYKGLSPMPANWESAAQAYLEKYKDVAGWAKVMATRKGLFKNKELEAALWHYRCYGKNEKRQGTGLDGYRRPGNLYGIFSMWSQDDGYINRPF